jgi:Sulfotransferase domain
MSELQVVGAGLGRTGTTSLKMALEQLLSGPCYHMLEVFGHPEHIPTWQAAITGDPVDWDGLFADYVATVDWPACPFWPELTARYPDALVLLSVRDPDAWYESASSTIFRVKAEDFGGELSEWHAWITRMFEIRFTGELEDKDACIAAFEAHNGAVRAAIPPERLLEWTAADGWGPICERLGLPVPDDPFPRLNTRDDWVTRSED